MQVEGLNSGSLEDYLSLVRTNYPLEKEDHLKLEQAARAAVTSGPAVYLTNLMVKLHGLKRKNVKCLVFFKENPEHLLESGVQVGAAVVKGIGRSCWSLEDMYELLESRVQVEVGRSCSSLEDR